MKGWYTGRGAWRQEGGTEGERLERLSGADDCLRNELRGNHEFVGGGELNRRMFGVRGADQRRVQGDSHLWLARASGGAECAVRDLGACHPVG